MKIIQLLPNFAYGDAIGNDTRAIDAVLKKMGIPTKIYAENINRRIPKGYAEQINNLPHLEKNDIIIYHGSTGSELNKKLQTFSCRKMMIYHNITPPDFFAPYNKEISDNLSRGEKEIGDLRDHIDYCIADSEFNKSDLLRMGFSCPIDVCPILIPFHDYEQEPDPEIIKQYCSDELTNILFVGRIVPNKKQEYLILSFYVYHKYFNPKSRLILCGSYTGMENYHLRLVDYAAQLGLTDDIIFTGHIKFCEILAWYRIADVFLCMSEHEGFCVPLLEAMYFKLPIIAYKSTAIPYTLGDAGILLDDKSPVTAAEKINAVIYDKDYRNVIIQKQNERLMDFSYENVSNRFQTLLDNFISALPR